MSIREVEQPKRNVASLGLAGLKVLDRLFREWVVVETECDLFEQGGGVGGD